MNPIRLEHWIYVTTPFFFYSIVVLALVLLGEHGEERNPVKMFFRRISWSLERASGYPGWAMAGALSALFALGLAMVGLYWDVAFHIDYGRDKNLFTPSHTMIVLGLGGLVYSAVIAVIFATLDRAEVGLRVAGLRVPWSAMALVALGVGGVAAFPLDDLWHKAYGVDVTLWSPTHLQLVAGGALAPIAVWLMFREASAGAEPTLLGRVVCVVSLGGVLTGLSTMQGEFDFGVPQFQAAYLPILIAMAGGMALVLARLAIGPGGALKAAVTFLILRVLLALLVGGALNHTVPRFPLYLVAALAVEAVISLAGRVAADEATGWRSFLASPLGGALAAGAAVGTVGLVGELVWIPLSGWFPGSPAVLPKVALLAPLAAMSGAVLGAALAWPAVHGARLPVAAAPAALVVLAVTLAVPLPRNVGPVDAVLRLDRVGDRGRVEVQLMPPDAARGATAFGVVAWQGGGHERAALRQVGPGRYVASNTLPVTGTWKTLVALQRGNQVMAAPVYLPADPEIGAPAVPAVAERRVTFGRLTSVLLREVHSGPAWPAVAAYSGLALVFSFWLAMFGWIAGRVGGSDSRSSPRREWASSPGPGPGPNPRVVARAGG